MNWFFVILLLLQNEMHIAVKQKLLGEPVGETLLGKKVSFNYLGFSTTSFPTNAFVHFVFSFLIFFSLFYFFNILE